MSSERLYTEAEAVEIIQRALNDPHNDSPATGLTKDDLWRIAEEAGATRAQFESALVTADLNSSITPPSNPFRSSNYSCVIDGELTPDDFVVIDEHIPDNLGTKALQREGRTMKVWISKGTTVTVGAISSRKGQTSIRVGTLAGQDFLPGIFATLLTFCAGVMLMVAGHSLAAMLAFVLTPIIGALVAMISIRFARKKSLEVFNLLASVVTQTLTSNTEDLSEVSTLTHDQSLPVELSLRSERER